MIPSKPIQAGSLPCKLNGKIDRKNVDTDKMISDEMGDDTGLIDAGIDFVIFIKMVVFLEEAFAFKFDDEMLLFTSFTNLYSLIKYAES